jgi:hypothetical protein
LPIYSATFINDGDEILLTGNRQHYYTFDVAEARLTRSNLGGIISDKNLSNVKASKNSDMMCIASKETGNAHILS